MRGPSWNFGLVYEFSKSSTTLLGISKPLRRWDCPVSGSGIVEVKPSASGESIQNLSVLRSHLRAHISKVVHYHLSSSRKNGTSTKSFGNYTYAPVSSKAIMLSLSIQETRPKCNPEAPFTLYPNTCLRITRMEYLGGCMYWKDQKDSFRQRIPISMAYHTVSLPTQCFVSATGATT